MAGKLLIDAHYSDETRVAIIDEDGKLDNFEAEYPARKPIKGNIYLAKVVRIEPAIQAAFIDYGGEKNGFLPLSEIHYDYFNKSVLKSLESDEENAGKNRRHIKIQEAISTKQILLVQAEKEIRGNKCAFFTTFISIPGRYCVLVPNPQKGKGNGVSKKIDSSEKTRLREIIASLGVPEGMNCIVRTAGESRTKQEIKRDLEYTCRLWNEIRDKVTSSTAPCLIHEEANIIKRVIRDLYQRTMDKIIVQGKNAYKESRAFMKTFTPSHVKKVELYEDTDTPLFHKHGVEDKIAKILEPTVSLPSGGTIVINTTEALTAIDVNSGKLKSERNIEETALKTNLEAAVEIARQIRLRDIAGIIVIDFIDMEEQKSNAKVEKKMHEAMKSDYSNIQFGKLSQFGLMEISRQRLRTSLADATFIPCSHCSGSGKVLADNTVALTVIRKIENFLITKNAKSVLVETAPGVDLFILNHKRKLISEMEQTYDVSLEITRNPAFSAMECKIFAKEYKPRANEKKNTEPKVVHAAVQENEPSAASVDNAAKPAVTEDGNPKNRRKRHGAGRTEKETEAVRTVKSDEPPVIEPSPSDTKEEAKPHRTRARRGRSQSGEAETGIPVTHTEDAVPQSVVMKQELQDKSPKDVSTQQEAEAPKQTRTRGRRVRQPRGGNRSFVGTAHQGDKVKVIAEKSEHTPPEVDKGRPENVGKEKPQPPARDGGASQAKVIPLERQIKHSPVEEQKDIAKPQTEGAEQAKANAAKPAPRRRGWLRKIFS